MELKPGWHVLLLNDMRSANIENLQPVACAETPQELEAFLEAEKVEPYTDGEPGECGHYGGAQCWGKTFRKGGPLEWYNQPDPIESFARWFPEPAPNIPHVSEFS